MASSFAPPTFGQLRLFLRTVPGQLPDAFPSGRFLRCLIEEVGQLGITW
jgi:hypothetical protein